jgi:hypothetical protein
VSTASKPIGILYEHPEWFTLLFAELERRGLAYERLYVDEHSFDPAVREPQYSLVVNRVSPSSYLRGHAGSILYARQVLAYLRDTGTPVVNGYDAYTLETSKALQLLLFERLGVRYPRARVVNHCSQLTRAAEGLTYPIIVKPNVGGSGALMQRFESPADLAAAVRAGTFDLGIDHTALVQEYLSPEGGCIVRVEILNGEYLYAIKIFTNPEEGFNLCPADICRTDLAPAQADLAPAQGAQMPPPGAQVGEACDFGAGAVASPTDVAGAARAAAGTVTAPRAPAEAAAAAVAKKPLKIEAYTPPREVVQDAIRLVKAGHLDVGGVEYLVASRDGQPYFYDVNALSNFVSDAPTILGFDPTARFVDYLERFARVRSLVSS